MSPYSGPYGTWWKIATALAPFLLASLIAFIRVQDDVRRLERDVQTKADAAVVQAYQQAILRELNGIEAKIDRIRMVPIQ